MGKNIEKENVKNRINNEDIDERKIKIISALLNL